MRGKDPETGEFHGPSRSQQRREALEVLDLAGQLAALSDAQLAKLPVPEHLLPHIRECRRITAQIAHKRQLQFLAKQLRREDDEVLEAIRDALDEKGEAARREVASMHRVEAWRERLIEDGDAALAELLQEYPHADRQHLRQLARNALDERRGNKPPRAFRELYRELRELMVMPDDGDEDAQDTGEDAFDEDQGR